MGGLMILGIYGFPSSHLVKERAGLSWTGLDWHGAIER